MTILDEGGVICYQSQPICHLLGIRAETCVGHAHVGASSGHTSQEVLVYNVSIPLLEDAFPDRTPFRVLEVET